MATLERVIENPLNGERMTFLTTGEETGGEFARVRCELPAGAPGPPLHYHLTFTETFEVVEGTLDMYVGGKKHHHVLKSGEAAHAPVKVPHTFWNSSAEPAVFEAVMQPAQPFEDTIRMAFGMAKDGKTNKKGVPTNIWELALAYELGGSYMTGMPLFLQRRIFGVLARIARRKGYDPAFSRYTKPRDETASPATPGS
ncbi:MAG: cupin domain-containing protein [Rubrobacteraceae bacterium]